MKLVSTATIPAIACLLAACPEAGEDTTQGSATTTTSATSGGGSDAASASSSGPTTSPSDPTLPGESTSVDPTTTSDTAATTTTTTTTGATEGDTAITGTDSDASSGSDSDASSGSDASSDSDASSGSSSTTGDTDTDTDTDTDGDAPYFPPCDLLQVSEPILLEDLSAITDRKPPAPITYDGADVVILREDWNPMLGKCEHLFERRDPTTGEVLGPGVRTPGMGVCGWNGAAGFDPVSGNFLLLTQSVATTLGITSYDAKGNKLWQKGEWALCNSLVQKMDVASRGGEWIITGETHHCGQGDRFTSVQAYTLAGERKYWLKTGLAIAATGSAACDAPACDRAITLNYGSEGGQSGIYAQMADLVAGTLDAKKTKLNGPAYGGWDASAAVWNGVDWLILRVEDTGPSHQAHVGRWDEALGWTTPVTTFPSGQTPTEIEVLWTGHDYVGVYAEFPDTNSQLPNSWFDTNIHIFLIGADGKLKKKQIFERSLGYGGFGAQIVLLPGAVGLTWVRVTKLPNNPLHYTRHYARITCAA